jgi:pimeloyl-ACP methyl ester carboxylesterase
MSELLDAVIGAHGGLGRWNSVRSIDATFNYSGGPGLRQREAIVARWKGQGAARAQLSELGTPVLVANGVADVMVPAEHSFAIARNAPKAKPILYPDAGHAFLFQYAHDCSAEILKFLEDEQ